MTNFKYRDAELEVLEQKTNYSIRVSNKFGFRWFQTSNKEDKFLKMGKAYEIEQEIINNPFGKYAFINPIII